MRRSRIIVAVIAAAAGSAASPVAWAGDQLTFPSMSGSAIAASAPATFVEPAGSTGPQAKLSFSAPSTPQANGVDLTTMALAPAAAAFHVERFGGSRRSAESDGYRFITHALGYSAFANYANDYYRLFAPGHAVGTWTDRVSGFADMGYGGAIDGWTVAAYYLPRLGGRHRDSAPDLSLMPTLRAHPELQQDPVFTTK